MNRQIFFWLLATLLLAGCQPPNPTSSSNSSESTAHSHDHGHDHGHQHPRGPHEGAIADWGAGVYHAEFKVDRASTTATVYILGPDEKTPTPIKTGDGTILLTISKPLFQVILEAKPEKGDPKGSSSRFVGKHESLGLLKHFAGTISGEVEGTPFAGEFEE